MKIKMKNRLHRYSINRLKSTHGHKYSKWKSDKDNAFMH